MLTRLCFALIGLAASVLPASAGPLQGVIDSATGAAEVRGIMGEVYVGFNSPSELVRPEYRQNPPVFVQIFPPPPSPRVAIVVVNPFSDSDGFVQLGEVFQTGLTIGQLRQIEFEHQATFTAEIVRPAPTFVPTAAGIPATQTGFFIIAVPEPSAPILAALALTACICSRRLLC